MKIKTNIKFIFVISILFLGCKNDTIKPKIEYNQKANELIQQLITEDNCHCILEIPKQTTIESLELENPKYDSELYFGKKTSKQNIIEIESSNKIYQDFKLQSEFIKTKNIKIIRRDSIRVLFKDVDFLTKTCKNGVTYFIKPNFNKNFDTAIILYGESGMCVGNGYKIFEFKNNKWKRK